MKPLFSIASHLLLIATAAAVVSLQAADWLALADLDKNGDGKLSLNEAQSHTEVSRNFARFDFNQDALLDDREYEALTHANRLQ